MLKQNTICEIRTRLNLDDSNLGFAWDKKILQAGESRFIWELLFSNEKRLIIPIAVGINMHDLRNDVYVIEIEKTSENISISRYGKIIQANIDYDVEPQYGILDTDTYSDVDWELYGEMFSECDVYSDEWKEWVNNNYQEEIYRRRRNYTEKQYLIDNNVEWLSQIDLDYNIFEFYREIREYWYINSKEYFDGYGETVGLNNIEELLGQLDLVNYDRIAEHHRDYEGLYEHVLVGDLVNEPLIDLLKYGKERKELDMYFAFIELLFRNGDQAVKNVLDVTILERIIGDTEIEKNFYLNASKELCEHAREV